MVFYSSVDLSLALYLFSSVIVSHGVVLEQQQPVTENYDVLVYDATSGGVIAAVAASRHGAKTALLCASWPACFAEGGKRVGGMSSGGLGQTDAGTGFDIINGLAGEFYARNRQHYGNMSTFSAPQTKEEIEAAANCRIPASGCNKTFNLEPHVALQIFTDMLEEANVTVYYEAQVDTVTKTGSEINQITLMNGMRFNSKVFIDASYEGDLFSRAGVSYIVGREASATYNESLNGRTIKNSGNEMGKLVNPYNDKGSTIPFVFNGTFVWPNGTVEELGFSEPHEADKKVQSYNFRLCTTKNASNMINFTEPLNYNPDNFELVRRYGGGNGPSCNTAPVPMGKFDTNNCGGVSTDFIGGSWGYPEATYEQRQVIWKQHMDWVKGLMWTYVNEFDMKGWGLCKDEFPITQGWPPALYVRAARRLKGPKVFTQNTPEMQKGQSIGNLSIGMGCYNFDSHNAQRMACKNIADCYGAGPNKINATTPYVWDEGDVQIAPGRYQIPFWVTLPDPTEAHNLLIVAAPSASHIGMSTLRMEPQFMIIGHSTGVAAALAANATGEVAKVPLDVLNKLLIADGQTLDAGPAPPSPPPANTLYNCLASRCIQLDEQTPAANATKDSTCNAKCGPILPKEWLANNGVFKIDANSITANQDTFLKKSEFHSTTLPISELMAVKKGVSILTSRQVVIDNDYTLITLTTTP